MCPAQNLFRSGDYQDFCPQLGELIMTPPILSDHYGTEVACALLPTLLKKAQIDMYVRVCGAGSPYAVTANAVRLLLPFCWPPRLYSEYQTKHFGRMINNIPNCGMRLRTNIVVYAIEQSLLHCY